ncbi:MAG TPA: nuclear transport factor 2 family protein [Drouetiella sp.]|jgi:SnoaL-like domain
MSDDKVAIQELTAKYANAMDDGDVQGWLKTWHECGVWEGGIGKYEGKERLTSLLPDLGARVIGKRHIMTNFVISINGDQATQTCYLLIIDRNKTVLPGTAVYKDKLKKVDNEWLFVHRHVEIDQPSTLFS